MSVTLNDMKKYLRVDSNEDNKLINTLITSAEQICMDIVRTDDSEFFYSCKNAKAAVMYATNYMYEHRTDADYHALSISLRALLFGERRASF